VPVGSVQLGENPARFVAAALLALLVSLVANRLRALTLDGGVAATIVGATVVGGAGWWAGATLVLFFVTATLLSKLGRSRDTAVRQQRGSQRDAVQVLANGGATALLALMVIATGEAVWILGVLCSIAVATADTWATEVGRLTGAIPRSISTLKPVPARTSGAISTPGTTASLIGGFLIGLFAAIGIGQGWLTAAASWPAALVVITVTGFTGSLLDSLFGATVQESFHCDTCGENMESIGLHGGHAVRRVVGIPGFNNDVVNLTSTLIPALVAVAIRHIA
jgi:uncharacterized protein (TIGR00297 family)